MLECLLIWHNLAFTFYDVVIILSDDNLDPVQTMLVQCNPALFRTQLVITRGRSDPGESGSSTELGPGQPLMVTHGLTSASTALSGLGPE